VFKRRVLRKIFWPKREKAIRDLRRLCNEKLHGVYCLPDIIGVITSGMKSGRVCGTYLGEHRCIQGCYGEI